MTVQQTIPSLKLFCIPAASCNMLAWVVTYQWMLPFQGEDAEVVSCFYEHLLACFVSAMTGQVRYSQATHCVRLLSVVMHLGTLNKCVMISGL